MHGGPASLFWPSMALSLNEIDTLEAALVEIASAGVVTVTVGGKTVTYQTPEQIITALEYVRKQVSRGARQRIYLADISRGGS